jgi:hypothetical protein
MNPFQAVRISNALQQLTLEQMEAAARGALSVTTPEDVQQLVASEFRGMEV